MNLAPPPHTPYQRVLDALHTITAAAAQPADPQRDALVVRVAAGRVLGRPLVSPWRS